MKALIIIPTYNEAYNISAIIKAVLAQNPDIEVLIVDDNSPDGTSKIVEEMKTPKIHLITREKKMGLGSAYVEGFKFALKKSYDFIFEMDADFSHDPEMIPIMLKEIQENDLIIGSRYIKGINVVNWPLR